MEISLSDGTSFLLLKEIVDSQQIEEGCELSSERWNKLSENSSRMESEKKALSLLARAAHSREGLRVKLMKRGFSPAIIDHTLVLMEEMGYLDDKKFAEQWLLSRIRNHPEGVHAFRAGLLKRGVRRDTVDLVLRENVTEEVELDCARRVVERIERTQKLTEIRMKIKMQNRGFSLSAIHKVAGSLRMPGRGGS
jgi:regulatory protein